MKLPLPIAPVKKTNSAQATLALNKKLDTASKAFHAALAKSDFNLAYQHILTAYKLVPTHSSILMDMAYTELRLGHFEKAFKRYLKAIEHSKGQVNPNIYDGITEVCHFLSNADGVKKYGRLALETKKNQVAMNAKIAEITQPTPVFNAQNPQENIIAYSLFGGLPRYCETSIINVDLAKQIYPEWTCRFYVDESVPDKIQSRLKDKGAQVVLVSESQKQLSGLFWRFLVMDDPTVNCFLVRDADSLVSYRERAAVDEWLQSQKWFHCMHDSYTHTELILAGMWGGFNGVLKHIEQHVHDFVRSGNFPDRRVMDQHYLRHCIWPTIQQSVFIHDSQGFEPSAAAFPIHTQATDFEDLKQFHIGMNEGSAQVSTLVNIPNASHVEWVIKDEKNQEVCRYYANVLSNRQITLELPRRYAVKINAKQWSLHTYLATKDN